MKKLSDKKVIGSPFASAHAERVKALHAALDAEPHETGWLIEGEMPDGAPGWMTLKPTEAMWGIVLTRDSSDALRFARRQDAEDYYACHIDEGPFRITEHRWLSGRAALAESGGK